MNYLYNLDKYLSCHPTFIEISFICLIQHLSPFYMISIYSSLFQFHYTGVSLFHYFLNCKIIHAFIVNCSSNMGFKMKLLPHHCNINSIRLLISDHCYASTVLCLCIICNYKNGICNCIFHCICNIHLFSLILYRKKLFFQYIRLYVLKVCIDPLLRI